MYLLMTLSVAVGVPSGKTCPWARLHAVMLSRMIITETWPWNVFTPAQTDFSLKGLAILSPASRQTLRDDLLSRTPKNPFFKKIDAKTWQKCKFAYHSLNAHEYATDYIFYYRLCNRPKTRVVNNCEPNGTSHHLPPEW